jgi:signal transduction histidine kinase
VAVDVATHLAPLAVAGQRLIEVVGSDRPIMVTGVRDSLFRAVRNLAENALVHTPIGSTVSIAVTDAPSISVSDRGPGIPVEQRSAIFERYWQGDRDRGGGVGLGLAIVAQTVAAHGGEIVVGDVAGGGALITIRFPPLPTAILPSPKLT